MAKTLREFGLQSDALIGSPEATQFLTTMKPAGTPGALSQTPSTAPITSADVTSAIPPTIQTPPSLTPPAVAKAEDFTPQVLGTVESEASDIIKRLRRANEETLGQTVFRGEQEQAVGLTDLQKQDADIFAQLKQQRAEFENIQNQGAVIEERMQQGAEGRGITAGGLAPLTAGELRKNTLRAIEAGSRANMTAALLAGIQGKITTAQSLVDRAVKQKFGAKEEERDALIFNLEMFLKDPSLSLEQKNRAEAQLAKKEKEKKEDEQKKADTKTIADWANNLAELGQIKEAQILFELAQKDEPNVEEAFGVYAPFAKKEERQVNKLWLMRLLIMILFPPMHK